MIAAPRSRLSERTAAALALALLLGLQVVCLALQRTPYFEDDAAFFFRYAENIAAGQGYRWNPEEPPVWGASAPLWPLLLAAGVKLGLSAAAACQLWSWTLALATTVLLAWVAWRCSGFLGILALAPLLAINHLYSTWATSGMESPLTFFLIASALAVTAVPARGVLLGAVAGLCLVHKVDLAPLGVVLLAGAVLWRREHARSAALVALAIAAAWYGFAQLHFGSVIPNSFLRMGANWGEMPHNWFVESALIAGAGEIRLPLAALGVFVLRKRSFLVAVALTALLVPSIAYTLKPPSEPFMWYAATVAPSLALLGAAGLGGALAWVTGERSTLARFGQAVLLLLPLGGWLAVREGPRVRAWHEYLSGVEPPLIAAGAWVDQHAPSDARVLTRWGHPAYASRRFVYDWSFLNRRLEEGNLLEKYAPEVWIDLSWKPLAQYGHPQQYRIVQTFGPPAGSRILNLTAIVLFRQDLQER
jgi:hypothetical protein